jgi:hypothetical protein
MFLGSQNFAQYIGSNALSGPSNCDGNHNENRNMDIMGDAKSLSGESRTRKGGEPGLNCQSGCIEGPNVQEN